jgi:hypothetical protein
LSKRTLVVLVWRSRGRRGPCQGLLGALRSSTAWSTLVLQDSHMVPLHLSSGATIHLSRWSHILQSTHSQLLHLELRNLLGWVSCASTTGVLDTLLESVPSLIRATLLGLCHHLIVCRRRCSAHYLRRLAVPTLLRSRIFLLVMKFLLVRSTYLSVQSLARAQNAKLTLLAIKALYSICTPRG